MDDIKSKSVYNRNNANLSCVLSDDFNFSDQDDCLSIQSGFKDRRSKSESNLDNRNYDRMGEKKSDIFINSDLENNN